MTDEELDALLRADAQAGPVDGGFGERLLHRLPPRSRAAPRYSRLPGRAVHLAALSVALCAFGLLWPGLSLEPGTQGAGTACGVLLALVVSWTLPQVRLNPWR